MRIRRIATEPADAGALKTWQWLGWLGSEYSTLDEVDALIYATFGSAASSIAAHVNSVIIDWIEMGVIECELPAGAGK